MATEKHCLGIKANNFICKPRKCVSVPLKTLKFSHLKIMKTRVRQPQVNVELPPELHHRLRIESVLRGVQMKDLVRQALEQFLGSPDDQKRKALKLIQASFNPPTIAVAA